MKVFLSLVLLCFYSFNLSWSDPRNDPAAPQIEARDIEQQKKLEAVAVTDPEQVDREQNENFKHCDTVYTDFINSNPGIKDNDVAMVNLSSDHLTCYKDTAEKCCGNPESCSGTIGKTLGIISVVPQFVQPIQAMLGKGIDPLQTCIMGGAATAAGISALTAQAYMCKKNRERCESKYKFHYDNLKISLENLKSKIASLDSKKDQNQINLLKSEIRQINSINTKLMQTSTTCEAFTTGGINKFLTAQTETQKTLNAFAQCQAALSTEDEPAYGDSVLGQNPLETEVDCSQPSNYADISCIKTGAFKTGSGFTDLSSPYANTLGGDATNVGPDEDLNDPNLADPDANINLAAGGGDSPDGSGGGSSGGGGFSGLGGAGGSSGSGGPAGAFKTGGPGYSGPVTGRVLTSLGKDPGEGGSTGSAGGGSYSYRPIGKKSFKRGNTKKSNGFKKTGLRRLAGLNIGNDKEMGSRSVNLFHRVNKQMNFKCHPRVMLDCNKPKTSPLKL